LDQRNSAPKVTVYTITYNQSEIVQRTVRGLFNQDYPSGQYEIVVLDDGSDDDTLSALKSLALQSPVPIKVLNCAHEADYLSARRWNQCIAAGSAHTEVFIQIDDVRLRPDFIRQHTKWHALETSFLVTGAKFEGQTETWDLNACQRAHLSGASGVAAQTQFFTAVWGASMSFSRRLMERVYQPPDELPYDERMSGWGFHEVEIACRMKKAGAQIIYDPAAGVFHQDHSPESEARRKLNRERLVNTGIRNNEQYLLRKHNLKELPRW
jgi:glycosyltransferase involved in cell wall biosynthesis